MNHLWQSSLFVVAVWVLTLALKKNRAAVRYWLWLAASVKFLIPFSLLVSLGSQFGWRTAPVVSQPQFSFVMEEIGRASVAPPIAVAAAAPGFNFVPILWAVWFCGFAVGIVLWMRWWLRIRAVLRGACMPSTAPCGRGSVEFRISATRMEPGVFGIFRPVLLLPEGIVDRLTPPQLEAILAHELCHVKRHDNLTAAIHMVAETIFWFHPLVWWIRARLIDERERACDEEVLRLGNEAEVYAEGILESCKLYLESPLVCVSGVTGSDLKKRIEAIMANRRTVGMNFSRKLLLAVAAIGAVLGPVVAGILNAPLVLAQSHAEFDVATVKLVKPGSPENRKITAAHGTLMMQQQTVRDCITWAYGLTAASQITGPEWIDAEQYDIAGKASETATQEELRLMLRALLAERFKLAIRRSTEQRPLFSLVVGKGGPKMQAVQEEPARGFHVDQDGNFLSYHMVTNMTRLAEILPGFLDQPLLDKTGLRGVYDFTLRVEMDPQFRWPERGQVFHGFGMTPSIFGAVEALGLKLVSEKGPVDVIVVDHVEKPTGNDQALFRKASWSPPAFGMFAPQSQTHGPGVPKAFEVASVKINKSGALDSEAQLLPGGRVMVRNVPLKLLITLAYHVRPNMVSGVPGWLDSDRYDVKAKAFPAASEDDLRVMMQTLLVERFMLAAHLERKTLPGYAMVVAKAGARLGKAEETRSGDSGCVPGAGMNTGQHHVVCHVLMDELAEALPMLAPGYFDKPVVDKTGLEGFYKFTLDWTGARQIDVLGGRTVFDAVELLGLKLESRKVSMAAVAIDHVERTPVEN